MAKTDYRTIDEYQAVFPVEIQEKMQAIRQLIHQLVPDVEECISYQIPCFKHYGYLIYYSAYAKHISLSYPYSDAFLAHFDSQLKGYTVSKSAIQFKHSDTLPMDFLAAIVQFRAKENHQNKDTKRTTQSRKPRQ